MRKATLSATETLKQNILLNIVPHRYQTISASGVTLGAVGLRLLFPLLLLELHVPIVHHSTRQLVDGHLLLIGEAQDVRCHLSMVQFLSAKNHRV